MFAKKGDNGKIEIHDSDYSWEELDRNDAIELAFDILKVALTS